MRIWDNPSIDIYQDTDFMEIMSDLLWYCDSIFSDLKSESGINFHLQEEQMNGIKFKLMAWGLWPAIILYFDHVKGVELEDWNEPLEVDFSYVYMWTN